jgi:hypothetical protein
MFNAKYPAIVSALALSVLIGTVGASSATTKKLTYEQAYAKCKATMDQEKTSPNSSHPNVRYTRGAGCMMKYGYRL